MCINKIGPCAHRVVIWMQCIRVVKAGYNVTVKVLPRWKPDALMILQGGNQWRSHSRVHCQELDRGGSEDVP